MQVNDLLLPNASLIGQTAVPKNAPGDPTRVNSAEAKEHTAMVEAAKEFESVILTRLLDEMKNTIGDWGLEKDSATKQIEGIFWNHLAQDLGDQGGMGLWRQMVASFNQPDSTNPNQLLDTNL